MASPALAAEKIDWGTEQSLGDLWDLGILKAEEEERGVEKAQRK